MALVVGNVVVKTVSSFDQFHLNFGSCLKKALVSVVVVVVVAVKTVSHYDQFYLNFGSCLKKALVVAVAHLPFYFAVALLGNFDLREDGLL